MLQEPSLKKKKKKATKKQYFCKSYSPGLAIAASVLLTSLGDVVWTQKCTVCELALWGNVKKRWMKRILSLAFGMLPKPSSTLPLLRWFSHLCNQLTKQIFLLPEGAHPAFTWCCFSYAGLFSCLESQRERWDENTVNFNCIWFCFGCFLGGVGVSFLLVGCLVVWLVLVNLVCV